MIDAVNPADLRHIATETGIAKRILRDGCLNAPDELDRLRLAVTYYEAALMYQSYTDSHRDALAKARKLSGWGD